MTDIVVGSGGLEWRGRATTSYSSPQLSTVYSVQCNITEREAHHHWRSGNNSTLPSPPLPPLQCNTGSQGFSMEKGKYQAKLHIYIEHTEQSCWNFLTMIKLIGDYKSNIPEYLSDYESIWMCWPKLFVNMILTPASFLLFSLHF